MSKSITYVIIRLAMDGLHYWKDAEDKIPEVGYLSNLHRHMFHFELKKHVTDADRQIEFISFKRKIKQYLSNKYFDGVYNCLNFDKMSCEMIAKELLDVFGCEYVMVLEDGEAGAEVFNAE